MTKRVILVAAVARNGVIGNGSEIPWRIPGEQRLFKELTMGDVLVMGRTTYESIGRPLPGRSTIVLTRDPGWSPSGLAGSHLATGAEGVQVAHSLFDALGRASVLPGEVMVVGGAEVYRQALPLATEQIISEIPLEPEGDVHYPDWDRRRWIESVREHHEGWDRVFWVRA